MTADQLHALAIRRFILVALVIPLAIVTVGVARTNGKRLVVTVDDADTGAGLLQALAARGTAARP